MTPPRSAFGASPPGGRRQRPGEAGSAAAAWLGSAAALPPLDPDRPFERFGAHPLPGGGVRFAVWAPRARRVSVVGDFNGWDGRCHPLQRDATGAWHGVVPAAQVGQRYKFELHSAQGHLLPLKADPFARQAELRPANASVIASPLAPPRPLSPARAQANAAGAPITIYELHAPSWRRGPGGRCLDWGELADQLPGYVRGLGFTHVELLPIAEHPFDGSWGYQVLGHYAPSARFGDPAGLHRFVAACHAAGLGVILDWVPAHFPADLHGLAAFDGEPLFEYADPREGRHRDWDTLIYDWRRPEVCDFLVGSALYWLECFGVDGLRVDAVASMLYRDYSRPSGEWLPNVHGGRENLEAVAFLRRLNAAVAQHCPGAILVAEESTAWPGVTAPVQAGGLGFAFKWNMGWMHDTLAYFREDPVHRAHHHGRVTFGLEYAFSERYVLALSHDEVVHGKGSLLAKMPGDDWQRFAHLRALYGLMWGHPGKKLLFMGQEFGQPSEWNHEAELPWSLLDDRRHRGLSDLVAALNALLAAEPALHRADHDPAGFEWRVADDAGQSVFAWLRHSGQGRPCLVVANLTPVPRYGYRIGLPPGAPQAWCVALDTDARRFGGSDWLQVHDAPVVAGAARRADEVPAHGQARSLALGLPPLAVLFLIPD